MSRFVILSLSVILAISGARASTVLSVGSSSAPGVARCASPLPDLDRARAQSFVCEPSAGEATDDEPFAVDPARIAEAPAVAPAGAKKDRFSWVLILIAFAGLTAVFAGKRTGGIGLIAG